MFELFLVLSIIMLAMKGIAIFLGVTFLQVLGAGVILVVAGLCITVLLCKITWS